ncbi:ABC transporter ATP-binding protein [Patulibacter sp. SYSU D01012]|uniref:ABC transporter ATP-binding protein n=1 Tax=Patulibacter sp. SYSU D01012 TaxID=2817381 RepID=UPI001B317A97|nr:ABC transporter ATP-binding protein [Patulibacter sp. SYSU D01012]
MTARALTVRGLTKRYGGVTAVSEASFDVQAGEIHGLIGPNGAGKSTMLGLISGFVPADEGSVRYGDEELVGTSALRTVRAGVSRTFQEATPLKGLSVFDNVLVGLHTHGRTGVLSQVLRTGALRRDERRLADRALALLEKVGITADPRTDAADLSFGQLRFLEIARALATAPSLLLLDEPAAGLNQVETERLGALIGEIRAEGTGVLLIDHDVPFVFGTCDRITAIDFGRIIASGTADEIEAHPTVRAAYLSVETEN